MDGRVFKRRLRRWNAAKICVQIFLRIRIVVPWRKLLRHLLLLLLLLLLLRLPAWRLDCHFRSLTDVSRCSCARPRDLFAVQIFVNGTRARLAVQRGGWRGCCWAGSRLAGAWLGNSALFGFLDEPVLVVVDSANKVEMLTEVNWNWVIAVNVYFLKFGYRASLGKNFSTLCVHLLHPVGLIL